MDKKQTAVEWLIEHMIQEGYLDFGNTLTFEKLKNVEQLAKDMEMNQISDSWNDGNLAGRNGWVDLEYSTGKGYYKETYGSSEKPNNH